MTKAEAIAIFESVAEEKEANDRIALFEAWCIYTDGLHRDGSITDRQVSTWSNPYSE